MTGKYRQLLYYVKFQNYFQSEPIFEIEGFKIAQKSTEMVKDPSKLGF